MVVQFESTVQIIDENDIVTNVPLRESDGTFYESLSGLYSEDHSSISLDGSSCLLDEDGFPPELAQADFISKMGTSFNSGDEPIDFFQNSSSSESMEILDDILNMQTIQQGSVGNFEGSFSLSHLLDQNSAQDGVPSRASSDTSSDDAPKRADDPDKVMAAAMAKGVATQGAVMLGLPYIFRFFSKLFEGATDDNIDETSTFPNNLNSGGETIADPDGYVALHQSSNSLSHSAGGLSRSEMMLSQAAQDSSRRGGAFLIR